MENIGLDGQAMFDPFGEKRGTFQFQNLLDSLKHKKEELSEWFEERGDKSEDSQLSDTE